MSRQEHRTRNLVPALPLKPYVILGKSFFPLGINIIFFICKIMKRTERSLSSISLLLNRPGWKVGFGKILIVRAARGAPPGCRLESLRSGKVGQASGQWCSQCCCACVNPQVWQASGRHQGKQGTCNCKQVKVGNGFSWGDGRGISPSLCCHLSQPKFLYRLIASTQELAAASQILVFSYKG